MHGKIMYGIKIKTCLGDTDMDGRWILDIWIQLNQDWVQWWLIFSIITKDKQ
jgi:hypothetical protein